MSQAYRQMSVRSNYGRPLNMVYTIAMNEPASVVKASNYLKYAIIALGIVLIVLGIFFVREYHAAQRARILDDIHHGVPLSASDVTIIRPWMTFDYINKIFNVSSSYLQTDLSISDPHYPRTSLSSYAEYSHTNITLLTNEVEGALNDYLMNSAH
jgi:hypothetical protein